MDGPDILARTLTTAAIKDKFQNTWQYHSQSDYHSKISCWALLFDLLQHCPQLASNIRAGKVGFGINHEMHDFRTGRKKNLDLVVCTFAGQQSASEKPFRELGSQYNIALTPRQASTLAELPDIGRARVGSVQIALEAKAAMTEHGKALPRLYDELNSSHLVIHGAADFAIAAGLAVVNVSETFLSPGRNKADLGANPPVITAHNQPAAAIRVIEKLLEIPRRTQQGAEGFDALGIIVIKLANDKSKVEIVHDHPARPSNDPFSYGQMIHRIASLYSIKFANI